ncbi:MAG: cryptochrome/photolyase family protein [Simkaniaceae bacterium]|nr:cryptochrome/photolyase family protein [Simkaniaceae bacterium]
MSDSTCFYLLGSHLFPHEDLPIDKSCPILMIEDRHLYTRFAFHKKRLLFLIEASRNYADSLGEKGYTVIYYELNSGSSSYETHFAKILKDEGITHLKTFEIEDRFHYEWIDLCVKKLKIKWEIFESPLFLNSGKEIEQELGHKKRPFMKTFYESERKRLDILMSSNGPVQGKFSFDAENRKPLPAAVVVPKRKPPKLSGHAKEVASLVEKEFSKHPGSTKNAWIPTTREEALKEMKRFFEEYFVLFGPYEDAISTRDPFLFHSALSPLINVGLLTPEEVLDTALSAKKIPIQSREGYVRQLIGWREFIRGIDLCFGEKQEKSNFFGHRRKMKSSWYNGTTGIATLDDAINKANEWGYCHHIERLMILSNLMFLCELDPKEVYCWFMELFVDSADWVMGPNVYGMGQFSDGGIFATKPYICGSNYLIKMSDYKKGPWCEIVDGLYWRAIDKKRKFFAKQPRLKMMVNTLDKMDPAKKKDLFAKAESFIKAHTH